MNKLNPEHIRIGGDNTLFIEEFLDYLGKDVIKQIKVTTKKSDNHSRGRLYTLGMKGEKESSVKLF